MHRSLRASQWFAVVLLCSSPLRANVFVVSSSGGGNYLDIPPAIAAVQEGDVLLVMPGAYSPFTLDKNLIVIGYGGPSIGGAVSIVNLSSTLPAAVVGVRPLAVSVSSCMSPVVLQDLGSIPSTLTIDVCNDVRMSGTDVAVSGSLPAPGPAGVTVGMARLEIVDATLAGYTSTTLCECTVDGRSALEARSASRVHLALVAATGGDGNDTYSPTTFVHAGSGAPAIRVLDQGEAIVAGGGSNAFVAGWPGWSLGHDGCALDGYPASGARVDDGGLLRVSGANFLGSCCVPYIHCVPQFWAPPITGNFTAAVPDDPTLRQVGTPAAGQTIQLTVRGRAGSTALLYFGRQAIVQPDPNSAIELLTPRARLIPLGTLPANGEATFAWTVPAALSPGTFLCAQAEVTLASGALQRTNSVPIVVR